jgi:YVTN family beta-propeller protein
MIKMIQMLKNPCLILIASLLLPACKKDNTPPSCIPRAKGVYVVNEGTFSAGNAELSFIFTENGSVNNNIFQCINGFALGDVAQSMTIHQGKGYLVVNNSQKIEVIEIPGANSIATITGFAGPRYIAVSGNRGYVSDWNSNTVKMVDLDQNTIVSSISVGKGPEQLLLTGNRLFVPNSGAYELDSTVSVIDTDNWTLLATINVGLNPNSIRKDDHGRIWVLCGGTTGLDYTGGTADDIGGSLWRIDPTSLTVDLMLPMNQFDHPFKLQTNAIGTKLYYLNGTDGYNGSIYTMDADDNFLPDSAFISGNFYGLGIDPLLGDTWASVAPSFTQNGHVLRYGMNATRIDSLKVGIGPNGFAFDY